MEQKVRAAVRPSVGKRPGFGWTGEPTMAHSRRLWLAAVAVSSVLALAAVIVCSVNGISLVVYVSLYVPIALAAYAFLWRGAVFGCGLALAYLVTMLAAFNGDSTTLIAAATRTLVFLALSIVVAVLAGSGRDAQRRIAVQRDLALWRSPSASGRWWRPAPTPSRWSPAVCASP